MYKKCLGVGQAGKELRVSLCVEWCAPGAQTWGHMEKSSVGADIWRPLGRRAREQGAPTPWAEDSSQGFLARLCSGLVLSRSSWPFHILHIGE